VSLLSSGRILIALEPDSLALVRTRGRWRRRATETRAVRCDPGFGAEPWQGAVAALARVAGELQGAGAAVTVVLSNHFVRYDLIPWSEGLGNAEEEAAFVRYRFAKVHGERSKAWDLRLSPGPAGSVRVASAVDLALVQALRECFPASGRARLASIQPYLMAAFNRWRPLVAGGRGWLLLVEPSRLCLARVEDGRWLAVRNTRGDFEDPAAWADLIDRERHRVGGDATPEAAYVHAPRNGEVPSSEVRGWTFRSLAIAPPEGLTPAEARPLAMALCAQ